ncbi:MAG TPA: ThuA domain-containing protein, partial [Candidatus Anammoximicrobium sp.]|nr:ThuA domain-containing protein [Candidatus Anammoximicrobium sp.]
MHRFSAVMLTLLIIAPALADNRFVVVKPVVEVEEEVYTFVPADNAAGPTWCSGAPTLVRLGETLFASGLETLPNFKPLHNVRWTFWKRDATGWELQQVDPKERTREPCPPVGFPDGRLLMSVNPTLVTDPERHAGPARPELLEFSAADPKQPPKTLSPAWDGDPPFGEHTYRFFGADAAAGEALMLNQISEDKMKQLGKSLAAVVLASVASLCQTPATADDITDDRCSPDELRKIEAAIPAKALVAPAKPRRLLMFDLNVGYPGPPTRFPGQQYPSHVDARGHRSIGHANVAFTQMGRRTGAFETVVSRDPAVFQSESLKRFDAVCFNNTVGNPFDDARLRQSLLEFVRGGGGLLGIHGASLTFTDWSKGGRDTWPEFGVMLGARGANHRDYRERIFIKVEDPGHPLTQVFGGAGFEYCSEFFRFHDPYSREQVRVLLSIDTAKTDLSGRKPERNDNDYALAWVRSYGQGRVFYSAIGHNAEVFSDPQ